MFVLNIYTPETSSWNLNISPNPEKEMHTIFGWLQPLTFGYSWKMSLDDRLNLISIQYTLPSPQKSGENHVGLYHSKYQGMVYLRPADSSSVHCFKRHVPSKTQAIIVEYGPTSIERC